MAGDDDWDPLAMDEEEAAANTKGDNSEATDEIQRIRKVDMEALFNKQLVKLMAAEPWKQPPKNFEVDTKFCTQTHTCIDWAHEDVLMKVGNGIAYVIFNRGEQNNTMQDTLGAGINDALQALHERPDLRIAVWTGEGRMYCAGGDPKGWQAQAAAAKSGVYTGDGTVGVRIPLKEASKEQQEHMWRLTMKATKVMQAPADTGRLGAAKQWDCWAKLPQFTICLANGSAMGGGVGCVCCCDYVISVKKAYFVLSEVKIGVIPATISPYVVAKLGESNSKRFFCAAENLAAPRAKELGIVNEVVDNMREGQDRIKAMCELMSSCSPDAVCRVKRLVFCCAGRPFDDGLLFQTVCLNAQAADSEQAKEGTQKVKPWQASPIGFDVWPDVGIMEKKKKGE